MRALIHGILALNFAVFMAAPTFAQTAPAAPAAAASSRSAVGANLPPDQLISQVVQPMVTRANGDCAVSAARIMGAVTDSDIYEAACTGGVGIVLNAAVPQTSTSAVSIVTCLGLKDLTTAISCTLSTDETNMALFAGLPAAAKQPCTVTNSRFVGENATSKTMFFEYACSEGPAAGFIAGADFKGAYKRVVPCLQADGLGGCKLSDVSGIVGDQNANFTRIARAGGFACQVKGVAPFPPKADSTTKASEIQCSDRPESAVVLQKADGTNAVMNCLHSKVEGYGCSFSQPALAYPMLTAELVSFGRSGCSVNNAHAVGKSTRNAFLEVTCSDGLQGYMMEYPLGESKLSDAIVCSQAGNLGGGCTMEGNVKPDATGAPK